MAEPTNTTNPSVLPTSQRLTDFFAEAQDKVEHIQGALRHRQQPQDVTFHLALKALRDGQTACRDVERMQRRIDELEGFIKGLSINCDGILRNYA